ncbi:MAG: hypothetical protein PF441_05335 [Desulfuromusa sp.]|jgi:chromosome segregation ATPase|nr:hypothetical protein [Desulfuromusa sp.]
MSELIHKSKIAALNQSNYELINEISNLKTERHDLNGEIERLKGENPDDIRHLREKITEYEQREAEFKERILSISEKAKNNNKKHEIVKQLLSALPVVDTVIVETAIEQYYKKRRAPKIIIAFLLGVLASLVAWLIAGYLENDQFYNTIIKWVKDTFYNYWA